VGAVEIRAAADDAALASSLAIWNLVYPEMAASAADERNYVAYCAGHLNLVACLAGEPVGSGFAAVEPDAAGPTIAKAHVAVVPEARGHGVGTSLYSALSVWAAKQGRTTLEAWVLDREPVGFAFAAKRGFREILREAMVALDLSGVVEPRVEAPPGVGIVTWAERPELAEGMYEVMLETLPDIPGNDEAMPSFASWLEHHMGGASDRPEATFVALAGEEVVGYAKLHLSEARPRVAVHDLTGVKRAWRGRGVARALKASQIAWAKREGYERLETANELRNAPIRNLNAAFGYQPIPGRALVRGPIATAAEEER
jgi:GNAT superfamily N-acetyltransferase